MARAALAVVYAHDRDDEVAALRQRVLELERSRDDLIWMDRLEQAIADCDGSNNRAFILDKVYEILVHPHRAAELGGAPSCDSRWHSAGIRPFLLQSVRASSASDRAHPDTGASGRG